MTCRPLREEPSLSSMKENALASRRVRTQPWRRIESAGCVALRASLTSVRDMAEAAGKGRFMTLANRKRGRQKARGKVPKKGRKKFPAPPNKARRIPVLEGMNSITIAHTGTGLSARSVIALLAISGGMALLAGCDSTESHVVSAPPPPSPVVAAQPVVVQQSTVPGAVVVAN